MAAYTASERAAIARTLEADGAARCPVCEATLNVQPVSRPESVSYVRSRVWVLCPGCRRTGAVDVQRSP